LVDVTSDPPLVDEDLVNTAGERTAMEGFLDYHRKVISGKLRGLPEDAARRSMVSSRTTLIGLVKHAAAVERNWFQHYLAGRPREQIAGNARGDADSWDVSPGETIADVIAEYSAACAESRRIAAAVDPANDDPQSARAAVTRSRGRPGDILARVVDLRTARSAHRK
jgi:hypothetical protein